MNTRQKAKRNKQLILKLLSISVSILDKELNNRKEQIVYKAKEYPPYYRELRVVGRIGAIAIEIRTKEQNHQRPHFHISIPGSGSASIAVDNYEILAGKLSAKDKKKVLSWAETNQELLMQAWDNCHGNVRVRVA